MGQLSKPCTFLASLPIGLLENQVFCKKPDAGINVEGAFLKMAASTGIKILKCLNNVEVNIKLVLKS